MNVKNGACIRKLSFRTVIAARKRNLIAIAAITLTALLFTSLFTIALSINESMQSYNFRQCGGYNHGTFKEVNEAQIAAISGHPKVKAVGKRTVIGFLGDGVFAKHPGELSYMDGNCTKWSYATPTVGRMPEKGKELAMDTDALALLGIQPELGAQVELSWSVGQAGRCQDHDTFTLVGWWEADDIAPVHYLNISEEYARLAQARALEENGEEFRTDLNVMLPSSVNIVGQMEQIDRDLGYTWDQMGAENNVRLGVNWGYTSERALKKMDFGMVLAIAAFLALVIFTGYLIIFNIFQISVTGDIRYYGLLKTIGVTPRQLKRIIRWQAVILCCLGIPLGLLLGYGIGALLMPVIMSVSNIPEGQTVSASPMIFLFSALFALGTVLLSCRRPGRIAAKVSPVEAVRYTDALPNLKKRRSSRGAKVHQMAFANLGRNKSKTSLVVLSLALAVVLLNVLTMFVGGFDTEKYLSAQICADFVVGPTNFFRGPVRNQEISEADIRVIQENTTTGLSGCGYVPRYAQNMAWMDEDAWRIDVGHYVSGKALEEYLSKRQRQDGQVLEDALIEGLDPALFEKLQVIEGSLDPLFSEGNAIAINVSPDDYGNVNTDYYPAIGEELTLRYIEEAYFIDSRTGEKSTIDTPDEYLQYHIAKFHDVTYRICAYVVVPYSMDYHFGGIGYSLVLPVESLKADSGMEPIPMVYLFDTPDAETEAAAERFLAEYTSDAGSIYQYQSKTTLRAEFENFQKMFLLVGGILCFIVGIVGILNFLNAVMTGILSRQREFAVLQAVGMTGRQLKKMLIFEGLFYALGAAAVALALSMLLNPLAISALETMFWWFSGKLMVLPVLLAIPVFGSLGVLVPTLMYPQVAKKSVVERLREAET